MNWSVVAGVAVGILALPILLMCLKAMGTIGWRRVLAHLFLYSCDVAAALVGFTLGFGLEVKSWLWLIVPMVLVRFAFYVVNSILAKGAKTREPI